MATNIWPSIVNHTQAVCSLGQSYKGCRTISGCKVMDPAWGPEGGREVSGLEHYHHMHGHTVKETGQPYTTPVMRSETLIKQGYIQGSHYSCVHGGIFLYGESFCLNF